MPTRRKLRMELEQRAEIDNRPENPLPRNSVPNRSRLEPVGSWERGSGGPFVRQAAGGELAPNSERSWDVLLPDGTRLQVKARVVTGKGRGERQLSVFRSWEFDAAIIILFDDEFVVRRAARLPVDVLREVAIYVGHVNGWRVIAPDDVLDRGEDWTSVVRKL